MDNVEKIHDVSMYWCPPDEEVDLDTIKQACIDRMKVLCAIQDIVRSLNRVVPPNISQIIADKLRELGYIDYVKSLESPKFSTDPTDIKRRVLDSVAHHTLLMILVSNQKLFRWTYEREIDLFAARIKSVVSSDLRKWLARYEIEYQVVEMEEKISLAEQLWNATPSLYDKNSNIDDMLKIEFYKVPFDELSNMINKRFLHQGFVYVPEYELTLPAIYLYSKGLEDRMTEMQKFNAVYLDSRFDELRIFFEKSLNITHPNEFDSETPPIELTDLPKLIDSSFPPCMIRTHTTLESSGHLKYPGRRQHQIFLKSIGLSADDCYKYMRKMFRNIQDDNKFYREYGYHLLHDYGLKGSKIDYSCFSCNTIISETPINKTYGCPFVDATSDSLKTELSRCKVDDDIEDIVKILAENNNESCKDACTFLLKRRAKLSSLNQISSPRDFFITLKYGPQSLKKISSDNSENIIEIKHNFQKISLLNTEELSTKSSSAEETNSNDPCCSKEIENYFVDNCFNSNLASDSDE